MKNKSLLFIILFCCINPSLCYSQNNIRETTDSIRKNVLNNPKRAKYFSKKLLTISKKQNSLSDQSVAYFYLAYIAGVNAQKDSTFYYYDKAIQKAIEGNDNNLLLQHKINKAEYLFEEHDFDTSLELYNECLSLSKKINDNYAYNYILMRRGDINYEIEKYDEALKIFKEAKKKQNYDRISKLNIQLSLSKIYLKLNLPDSANNYIKQGLKDSKMYKYFDLEIKFQNQLVLNFIHKKDYQKAENVFKELTPLVNKYDVISLSRLTLINKARLLTLQKEHLKSIEILTTILKDAEKRPLLTDNRVEIDNILAENYKQIGDTKNASLYLEKYIEDSKKIGQKKIETIEYLNNLNINEIEQEKASLTSQKWILICTLGTLCMLFGYYIYKRRKSDQQKFDFLIQKIEKYETDLKLEEKTDSNDIHLNQHSFTNLNNNPQESITTNDEIIDQSIDIEEIEENTNNIELLNTQEEIKEENISGFIIKDEKINEILDGLIKLEEKKYFLKQECTLHTVAKKLKTNTAYLSKIINNELGKSFSTYINELRINYIIVELKNNSKLRSYSVNAIAIEIGYKRPDAFTKYFKEATGLTPAIYIKKINQMNKN